MSSSRCWGNSFNLRESPEPLPINYTLKQIVTSVNLNILLHLFLSKFIPWFLLLTFLNVGVLLLLSLEIGLLASSVIISVQSFDDLRIGHVSILRWLLLHHF